MAEVATSPGSERQSFLEATTEGRVAVLVRKWMDGARLSAVERDEVAQILPDAIEINVEEVSQPQRAEGMTEDEVLKVYGISRAKYFRWKKEGQAVSDGPDAPPFDDPKAMVAWYERMKGRGTFKHQCPASLKALASKGVAAAKAAASTSQPGQDSVPPAKQHQGQAQGQAQIPEEERGFLVELEKQEIKTARERRAADDAFAENRLDDYALLNAQHRASLDLLRKMQTQKETVALAEKSMMRTADLVETQGLIVRSIIRGLTAPHLLKPIYEQLNLQAAGLAFDAFVAIQAAHVKDCFGELVRANLAEPYALEAA